MTEERFPHLADIGFERVLPVPALQPYVQSFWYINSRSRIRVQRDEFMHPDGSLGLVFNWGDTLELSDGRYPQTVILDKVSPQSRQLKLIGNVKAFGILFRPGGAFPVFGMPMHELSSTDSLTAHSLPLRLPQLHAQLYEAPALVDKVTLIETWLESFLQRAQPLSPVIKPTLELISRSHGRLLVKQLADEVSISSRQLERLYKKQIGLSPKKLAQLLRVRQARAALNQRGGHTLVEIAYLCGFYDQAHFIREFKAVMGLTPGAYLARQQRRPIGVELAPHQP